MTQKRAIMSILFYGAIKTLAKAIDSETLFREAVSRDETKFRALLCSQTGVWEQVKMGRRASSESIPTETVGTR